MYWKVETVSADRNPLWSPVNGRCYIVKIYDYRFYKL